MDEDGSVPALILSAGLGSRFAAAGGDGPKVLATVDGRPLLHHVVSRAFDAGCAPVTVVLHPALVGSPEVRALEADRPGERRLRLVTNPEPAAGIGASLAVGLRELSPTAAEACVVLLADQPGIDPAVVRRVVEAWRRTGRAARARYVDGESHPTVLPRALWPALLDAPGGTAEGARGMLAAADVVAVDVDGPAPRDVDVPSDLDGPTGAKDEDGR